MSSGDLLSLFPAGSRLDSSILTVGECRADDLARLPLVAPDGHLVRVSQVAMVAITAGQTQLTREDLAPFVAVTARLEGRDLGSAMRDVRSTVAGLSLPPSVRVAYGGLYAQQQQSFADLAMVFAAAFYALYTGVSSGARPLVAVVTALVLYNGSVLAEVFRAGILSLPKGQTEAAVAIGMRKTQVTTYVLAPQAVRAMLPTIISQLVVALKDTSLGYLITYEEFLHAGKLIASNLDYDLPFIPVVMVISPIYIGMCMLLSWFATWVAKRQRRNLKTRAVRVAPAEPGTLLPGGQ